jgi:hypothetical protein
MFPTVLGDNEDGFQPSVFHYTTNENRVLIEGSGEILPGQSSGLAWVTPTAYDTAESVQSDLALPNTPDGYFIIPFQNVRSTLIWSTVAPNFGFPGGGIEGTTPLSIPIGGSVWVPFRR